MYIYASESTNLNCKDMVPKVQLHADSYFSLIGLHSTIGGPATSALSTVPASCMPLNDIILIFQEGGLLRYYNMLLHSAYAQQLL